MASPVLEHKQSLDLLEKLPEPKDVFMYLLMCLETPRPSAKEELIRNKLCAFAKQHGLDAAVDKQGLCE